MYKHQDEEHITKLRNVATKAKLYFEYRRADADFEGHAMNQEYFEEVLCRLENVIDDTHKMLIALNGVQGK
jgi:hypothetical protein